MSWGCLEAGDPELAAFGKERLADGFAFLATVRKDGSPRVHPVTPIVGDGHIFIFMEPGSPKGRDLRRDGRYALHSAVGDPDEGQGEFFVSGRANPVEDEEVRDNAARLASYAPEDRYVLFELTVESAFSTVYDAEDTPIRRRWKSG